MDSAMTDSVGLMCSSEAIVVSAGAMMVLTIMRLKLVAERTSVTAHLRLLGQFRGLSGSKVGVEVTRWRSWDLVKRGDNCMSVLGLIGAIRSGERGGEVDIVGVSMFA